MKIRNVLGNCQTYYKFWIGISLRSALFRTGDDGHSCSVAVTATATMDGWWLFVMVCDSCAFGFCCGGFHIYSPVRQLACQMLDPLHPPALWYNFSGSMDGYLYRLIGLNMGMRISGGRYNPVSRQKLCTNMWSVVRIGFLFRTFCFVRHFCRYSKNT